MDSAVKKPIRTTSRNSSCFQRFCRSPAVSLMNAFGQQAMILLSSSLVETQFMMINLTWIYVALGISIGAFGSIISMRRFLQA